MTVYGMRLLPQHAEMLQASRITPDHARERGYVSVTEKKRLENLKIVKAGRSVPGLLIPERRVDGSIWGYQYRPDNPRTKADGEVNKYETPYQQRNGIDVPPGVGPKLGDPSIPLFITEGVKKADSAVCEGLACIAIPGVWNWLGKNPEGGKVAVPDWRDVALNGRRVILAFDSDVVVKKSVQSALAHLAGYLESKDAKVEYLHLPNRGDGKTGVDDYLADGHTVEDLWKLVRPDPPEVIKTQPEEPVDGPTPQPAKHEPISLDQAHAVFKRWLGDDYDLDALDAMLAAAAVERLDGDPVWLLIISGSGNAKTETVQALSGISATVVSTITSEGALLSATSKRERTSEATGGLLREIGDRGVLVVKDVTSILSMNRDLRGQVLGALREIHDGSWVRKAGTDGGRSLPWSGRIAVIGAVTTKWDQAHDVIASMGDRFVLYRVDSTSGRQAAGRKAIGNTGAEIQMRKQLADAVAGVLAGMEATGITLTDEETDIVLAAADLVTLARTGVEYDYRGDVIDAHAPEMPTRFAKELTQIIRGAVAIGMRRHKALRLAIQGGRDSMPPLRLAIIDDLSSNPGSTLADVRRRLNKPRSTVDRQLQALHILSVLGVEEVEEAPATGGKVTTRWYYTLAEGIDPEALNLDRLPEMSVGAPRPSEERDRDSEEHSMDGDISGKRVPTCRLNGCGVALYNPQSAAIGMCVVHQGNGQTR